MVPCPPRGFRVQPPLTTASAWRAPGLACALGPHIRFAVQAALLCVCFYGPSRRVHLQRTHAHSVIHLFRPVEYWENGEYGVDPAVRLKKKASTLLVYLSLPASLHLHTCALMAIRHIQHRSQEISSPV